jgi:hypothetical protein
VIRTKGTSTTLSLFDIKSETNTDSSLAYLAFYANQNRLKNRLDFLFSNGNFHKYHTELACQ